jgi:hypothetical protein
MTATVATTATQESDNPPPVATVAAVAVATSPELPPDEEKIILAWLELIEETDPVLIEDVLTKCRNNLKDRRYYLKRSTEEVPLPPTDAVASVV